MIIREYTADRRAFLSDGLECMGWTGRWERPKSLAIQRTKRARGSFVLRKNSVVEAGWLDLYGFHDGLINGQTSHDHRINFGAEGLHGRLTLQWELIKDSL